jgi:hexosaminidase
VNNYVADSCKDAGLAKEVRHRLAVWRDNDGMLQPLTQRSALVKEVSAVSQDLSTVGAIGIAALDWIAKGQPAGDAWKAEQSAVLELVKKPKAQLLMIPAPAVQKLVEAAAGGTCVTK